MFNLHKFIMDTILGMVGNEPDYKVRQYALGWHTKGELTTEDMAEIELAIETSHIAVELPPVEMPIEPPVEEIPETLPADEAI